MYDLINDFMNSPEFKNLADSISFDNKILYDRGADSEMKKKYRDELLKKKKVEKASFLYNMYDLQEKYIYHVLAPAIPKDYVSVEYEDNSLIITIKRRPVGPECIYSDFNIGGTNRILLPKNCDAEKITSKLENGVIVITVPKLSDSKRTKINID